MCIASPPDKGDLGGFFITSPPDKGDLGGFFAEKASTHYRLGLCRAGTHL